MQIYTANSIFKSYPDTQLLSGQQRHTRSSGSPWGPWIPVFTKKGPRWLVLDNRYFHWYGRTVIIALVWRPSVSSVITQFGRQKQSQLRINTVLKFYLRTPIFVVLVLLKTSCWQLKCHDVLRFCHTTAPTKLKTTNIQLITYIISVSSFINTLCNILT